jgi:hypothetical protein
MGDCRSLEAAVPGAFRRAAVKVILHPAHRVIGPYAHRAVGRELSDLQRVSAFWTFGADRRASERQKLGFHAGHRCTHGGRSLRGHGLGRWNRNRHGLGWAFILKF